MLRPFETWDALLAYLDAHNDIVHYQAPLDRHAVPVVVTRRFKNGKLRIAYHHYGFTADRGHLDRFRGKQEEAQDVEPSIPCPRPGCSGEALLLGILGSLAHYRCRDCGTDSNSRGGFES